MVQCKDASGCLYHSGQGQIITVEDYYNKGLGEVVLSTFGWQCPVFSAVKSPKICLTLQMPWIRPLQKGLNLISHSLFYCITINFLPTSADQTVPKVSRFHPLPVIKRHKIPVSGSYLSSACRPSASCLWPRVLVASGMSHWTPCSVARWSGRRWSPPGAANSSICLAATTTSWGWEGKLKKWSRKRRYKERSEG